MALSLSDLSVWCYSCNKYVKSTCLEHTLALAAYYKHHETGFPAGTKEGGPLQYSKTAVCFDGRGTERHRPERKTGVFALERPERTQKAIDLLSERNILSRYAEIFCYIVIWLSLITHGCRGGVSLYDPWPPQSICCRLCTPAATFLCYKVINASYIYQ